MKNTPTSADHGRVLRINYSGRIIDHLGLQMYQSPVAAVAELVANAWDADADNVKITLPAKLAKAAELVVEDDGNGMSFAECQARFLNVGYARRGNKARELSKRKKRRILGRKGIGKFAAPSPKPGVEQAALLPEAGFGGIASGTKPSALWR